MKTQMNSWASTTIGKYINLWGALILFALIVHLDGWHSGDYPPHIPGITIQLPRANTCVQYLILSRMVEKFGRYSGLCCQHCVMMRYLKMKENPLRKIIVKDVFQCDVSLGPEEKHSVNGSKEWSKSRCHFCILGSQQKADPVVV